MAKEKKACPVSKVKAEFKVGNKVYEVCAKGTKPVVVRLTDSMLARRTRGQAAAAAKAAKRAQKAAHESVMKNFHPGESYDGYKRKHKKHRRSRR